MLVRGHRTVTQILNMVRVQDPTETWTDLMREASKLSIQYVQSGQEFSILY